MRHFAKSKTILVTFLYSKVRHFMLRDFYENFEVGIYCKYEIPDHKGGIYCNVIVPLAELRHSAFSCKKVLRYFCQNRRTSYSGTVR